MFLFSSAAFFIPRSDFYVLVYINVRVDLAISVVLLIGLLVACPGIVIVP